MVGGLADWFAVTALFRRPLHLPIPHTAIIPQKKDEIAAKLGTFVTANFLTPELMVRHLQDADIVAKIGVWLRDPANADGLGAEVSHAAWVALEEIDEDSLFDYVLELARRDLARRSYAPVLGQVLARAVEGEAQRPLVDMIATRARVYIRENRAALRPQLKDWLESKHFVAWLLITDKRTDWLIDRTLDELDEIGRDPQHPWRRRLDELLRSLAADLETNQVTAARVDLAVRRLVRRRAVPGSGSSVHPGGDRVLPHLARRPGQRAGRRGCRSSSRTSGNGSPTTRSSGHRSKAGCSARSSTRSASTATS